VRQALRRALLVGVGLLYALSIPWYRGADDVPEELLGLPDWVAVALLCYAGAALLNAGAWLLSDIPDEEAAPELELPDDRSGEPL